MMKKTTKRIIGLLFGVAFLLSITFPALAAYSHFETGVVSETGFYVGASGTEVEVIDENGTLIIDGVELTATATEINYLADVTPGIVSAEKAVITDLYGAVDALDIGTLSINGSEVTSTAADINTLTGVASQFIVYQVEDLEADGDIAALANFSGILFSADKSSLIKLSQLKLKFYTNAGLNSGDPFVAGQIPAVALGDEDSDKYTVGRLAGVFDLSVKGIDASGNSAVSIGDKIYYVAEDTPKLSKKAAGVFFGYALEAIDSGATATIQVLLK